MDFVQVGSGVGSRGLGTVISHITGLMHIKYTLVLCQNRYLCLFHPRLPDESIFKYLEALDPAGNLSPNFSVSEHWPTNHTAIIISLD